MARLISSSWTCILGVTAFWMAVTAALWLFGLPWYVNRTYTMESFVTNNRQDGPPTITISNGPIRYGEVNEGGSPVVYVDWLAKRLFYDYRTLYIYENNALGPNVCTIYLNRPRDEQRIEALREEIEELEAAGAPIEKIDRLRENLADAENQGLFRNRPGSVQPTGGYSLDRWSNGKLSRCKLQPGKYVAVTEYRIPVLGGWFEVPLTFTSNIFEVTS